jgi:hypothetical protein
MKKITLFIIVVVFLLFLSCINNKNDMITIVNCNGISGKPEYMLFKTENVGYMFIYKGNMYSSSADVSIFIFKTTDGGENWEQIYSQDGYIFARYSIFTLFNNAIFGTVENPEDITKPNLFKLDLTTQEFKLLDNDTLGVDGVGGFILIKNDSIVTFFSKDKYRGTLTTDTDFSSFSLKSFNYTVKFVTNANDGIVSDSTSIYFITWKNQLVIETNNEYKEIAINNPVGITKIAENKVLIATNEQENTIILYQFDVTNNKLGKLQTIENYSIISHLQSNEKVIVGFVGNIKGMFVEYDLIYSTDKGQSWQIQKLKENKLVSPNCLFDNILYIYLGRKLQKVTF